MSSFLTKLRAVPELIAAYTRLRADADAALKDPAVRDAVTRLRNDPALALTYPRISAEWRAVEEAMHKLR